MCFIILMKPIRILESSGLVNAYVQIYKTIPQDFRWFLQLLSSYFTSDSLRQDSYLSQQSSKFLSINFIYYHLLGVLSTTWNSLSLLLAIWFFKVDVGKLKSKSSVSEALLKKSPTFPVLFFFIELLRTARSSSIIFDLSSRHRRNSPRHIRTTKEL